MPRVRSLPLLRTIGPVHSVVHVVRKQQLQAADLSLMHGYTHRQSHRQRIASASCQAAMVAAPIAQDRWPGPGGCACSAGVVAAGLWHRAGPRGAKPKREQNRSFDPYTRAARQLSTGRSSVAQPSRRTSPGDGSVNCGSASGCPSATTHSASGFPHQPHTRLMKTLPWHSTSSRPP